MSEPGAMTLTFRCPPELDGLLPRPIPASRALPEWFKAMPQKSFNPTASIEDDTVKRCSPFVDAMTAGFLIPLICDVRVEDGEFTWDNSLPPAGAAEFERAPIGFHPSSQVIGSPLFRTDRFLIKFHNLWTIEAPAGYSLLFTHPANRFDLPFTTLSGVVDCDRYHDARIHFPAHWHDEAFSGVLSKGTPVAQCIPIRRDAWTAKTAVFSEEEAKANRELNARILREKGVYRRHYRA